MSLLAQQLIAENKATKNPFLDLGNCGLTELPDELFDCVWLENLNFVLNKIKIC
jgi:internalin A